MICPITIKNWSATCNPSFRFVAGVRWRDRRFASWWGWGWVWWASCFSSSSSCASCCVTIDPNWSLSILSTGAYHRDVIYIPCLVSTHRPNADGVFRSQTSAEVRTKICVWSISRAQLKVSYKSDLWCNFDASLPRFKTTADWCCCLLKQIISFCSLIQVSRPKFTSFRRFRVEGQFEVVT